MSSDAFSSQSSDAPQDVRGPGSVEDATEQPTALEVADPESVGTKQSFSGLKQSRRGSPSSQDVRGLVEGIHFSQPLQEHETASWGSLVDDVDYSQPLLEGEVARPPMRMDLFPMPSTSRCTGLGPALSCAVPQLSRPCAVPVPQNFGAEGAAVSPQPGQFRILEERERQYRNFELIAREITVLVEPPRPEDNPHTWLRFNLRTS